MNVKQNFVREKKSFLVFVAALPEVTRISKSFYPKNSGRMSLSLFEA